MPAHDKKTAGLATSEKRTFAAVGDNILPACVNGDDYTASLCGWLIAQPARVNDHTASMCEWLYSQHV